MTSVLFWHQLFWALDPDFTARALAELIWALSWRTCVLILPLVILVKYLRRK